MQPLLTGQPTRAVRADSLSHTNLPVGRLVDVERWRYWFLSGRGQATLLRWAAHSPALLGWEGDRSVRLPNGSLRIAFEAPVSGSRTDAMQGALVELAQRGDTEAAVTLLVQLQPGLHRLTRSLAVGGSLMPRDVVEEVRATFFEVLAGHSLLRRPKRVAANLLLDTRQRLNRALRPPAGPSAVERPTDIPDVDAMTELLVYDTIRSAVRAMPGSHGSRTLTADVAYRAWVLGQPATVIADELGLGSPGVRSRLHRLRTAMRAESSPARFA